MDRDQLRAIQKPLKERYRDDAAAAVITLRAQASLGEGLSCGVETGGTPSDARVELDCDATPEQRRKLLKLTERHCVVYQTRKNSPALHVAVRGAR